ncbi:MAG: amidohydrolase [Candidatus Zixiibacteriota bacterium]
MKAKSLICNARIYTQANDLVVNSMAVCQGRVEAIGDDLQHAAEFRSYRRVDLKGKTVLPGFVDAHTHFHFFALSLGRVLLDGLDSLEGCLQKIEAHAQKLARHEWVVGEGYSPDRFYKRVEPNRYHLDWVTGGRPAFLFSKDQHSAWVNSRALELAGISKTTPDPTGGAIMRFDDGAPTGILREPSGYGPVYDRIPDPPRARVDPLWRQALDYAYRKGVTGVHSFDGADGFVYLSELAQRDKVGLRINYYAPAALLPQLQKTETRYGTGTDYFRIAGIKIYADGSLGSQTALCFQRYKGSRNNYGIEVTSTAEIRRLVHDAATLGLPCAVHAIGDRAVANVLDALTGAPRLPEAARHRIEHVQLIRRQDVRRLKKLRVVASMQPSHCPSDIPLVREYWGARGANAYVFRSIIDAGVDVAFGSDAPIEPLDPIAGIAAAVRRPKPGSRDAFFPEQRISAAEAVHRFTVGPAVACGEAHCRGMLLPGYPADFVVLSEDLTRIPPTRIQDTEVLATVLGGDAKYSHSSLRF